MSFTQYDEHSFQMYNFRWSGAGAVGDWTLLSSLADVTRIDGMQIRNPDSIDHNVTVKVARGGAPSEIQTVLIPAGAGTSGIPGVDLIPIIAPVGLGCILLARDGFLGVNLPEDIVDDINFDITLYTFAF